MMPKNLRNLYINLLTFRSERIFFVYGMRRSGNHACIRWLARALEDRPIDLHKIEKSHTFRSTTKDTVLINDIARPSKEDAFAVFFRNSALIWKARFIIVSAEDVAYEYVRNWRIPAGAEPICVWRSALNVIASRFQSLHNSAGFGVADKNKDMGDKFFRNIQLNKDDDNGERFDFDEFISSAHWRREFLNRLAISSSIAPYDSTAPEGQGSSFTGVAQNPDAVALSKRYEMTEPVAIWRKYISEIAKRYPDLWSEAERAALAESLGVKVCSDN